jgi:hypothetical protein
MRVAPSKTKFEVIFLNKCISIELECTFAGEKTILLTGIAKSLSQVIENMSKNNLMLMGQCTFKYPMIYNKFIKSHVDARRYIFPDFIKFKTDIKATITIITKIARTAPYLLFW